MAKSKRASPEQYARWDRARKAFAKVEATYAAAMGEMEDAKMSIHETELPLWASNEQISAFTDRLYDPTKRSIES